MRIDRRGFLKTLSLGAAAVTFLGRSALVQPANAAPAGPAGPLAFSPEAVEKAIKKGVEYLKKSQGADGSWPPHAEQYPVGPTAIATYALLESDMIKVTDPKIKSALDWLSKRQVPAKMLAGIRAGAAANAGGTNTFCNKTYELGLRANAFLAAMKRSGMVNSPYKQFLRGDVLMLMWSTKDGSYGYDSFGNGMSAGDNSNSQYGVLGVWAGVQADEEVPRDYWYKVMKHWLECQCSDGGWTYSGNRDATATMTTAGLASMFLCYDNLLADGFVKCDQGPTVQAVLRPLNKGLDWMDKYFQGSGGQRGIGNNFYLLYGIERVGLASGYKYFGKSDWYKVGAEQLIRTQGGDGSWVGGYGNVVDTAYALLFLVRGRHAILFNKLEYDGDWNERPRDMAKLTQWIGKIFEESTVNWQIVNLKVKPEEWLDAPILYLSGSIAPKFTDDQIAAIRRYVNMGGTILSCTECDGKGFKDGIRAVYAKMFPKYKLELLPKDHKFFTYNFKLDSKISTLQGLEMIHNGVRPLVVHTDNDMPKSWQLMLSASDKESFEGPANIALYLTDGAVAEKALAARGSTTWPGKPEGAMTRQVKVARLTYSTAAGKEGNCDPEPLAWERFSRIMGTKYKVDVDVSELMPISKLAESRADVAVLCGTDRIIANDQEIRALQAFVNGGGLLYMEAVGGAWAGRNAAAFAESGEALANQVATELSDTVATTKRLRRLTIDSPIFAQKEFEIKDVKFRKFSRPKMSDSRPQLRAILNAKNLPIILFSNEDLTGGLVGFTCDEVHGYARESAFELMRNIVMTKAHAPVATQPATQPTTQPAGAAGAPK
jgi:hypothetical protein